MVRGADPETFEVLNQRYAKDKSAGYYITNLRLPCKDADTFGVISYYYGRGQKPVLHTDESCYAKDSENVYGYGVKIKEADAATFEPIGDEGRYFADKDRIFWERTHIVDADRGTFVCASEAGQYRAFDKNRPFFSGIPQSSSIDKRLWDRFFQTIQS